MAGPPCDRVRRSTSAARLTRAGGRDLLHAGFRSLPNSERARRAAAGSAAFADRAHWRAGNEDRALFVAKV